MRLTDISAVLEAHHCIDFTQKCHALPESEVARKQLIVHRILASNKPLDYQLKSEVVGVILASSIQQHTKEPEVAGVSDMLVNTG